MSMTSKVNLALRKSIIDFLTPGTTATNNGLKQHIARDLSTRAIQEATQKLTAEGILVATKESGKTWYGLAPVKIQYRVKGSETWIQSKNEGTTGVYPVSEALAIISRQPDSEFLEYRTAVAV